MTWLISSCAAAPKEIPPQIDLKEKTLNPETLLVDVRIAEQFKEKTAQGAINIPLAILGDSIIAYFKKQKQVVVFCNKGKQATEAYHFLKKHGVENVYFGKTLDNIQAIQNEKK